MDFRIELLGEFRLIDLRTHTEIPIRSYRIVLVALALNRDRLVPRRELEVNIFPDGDTIAAQNRMRVALFRLRKVIGSALVESGGMVGLQSGLVECDLWEADDLCQDFRDAPDVETQLSSLIAASQMSLERGALHLQNTAPEFARQLLSELRIAVRLAAESGKHEDGFRLALSGLRLAAGDRGEALKELFSAAIDFGNEIGGGASPAEQIEMALGSSERLSGEERTKLKLLRSGAANKDSVNTLERRFLIELLQIGIRNYPELIRQLLAKPEALPFAGQNPAMMIVLLEQVVGELEPGDDVQERCLARLVGLRAWQNDAQGVLRDAPALLNSSKNPLVLRATWNYVSLAHALSRNWQEADDALVKTEEFARESGDDIDLLSVQGTRAFYLLHQGKYGEATREYDLCLDSLRQIDHPRAALDFAVANGYRAMIPVYAGEWEAGMEALSRAIAIRKDMNPPCQHSLLSSARSFCGIKLERREDVLLDMVDALREAFNGSVARDQILTLEFLARVLFELQQADFAASICDRTDHWRRDCHLPRSEAEESLVRMIDRSGEPPDEIQPEILARQGIRVLKRALS